MSSRRNGGPRRLKKIAIGIPMVEMCFSRFVEAWAQVNIPYAVPKKFEIGQQIGSAYDRIARWFLEETDADYLLTMEQDHRYPANLLERVARYDQPIVGAVYCARHEPHQLVAGVPYPEDWLRREVWAGDWSGIRATPPWPSLWKRWRTEQRLERVLFVGLGCTAIRRDVFEAWPKDRPYFQDDWWAPLASHRTCDVRFCHEAAKLGFATYLDCAMAIPHMTVREITEADFWRELERKAAELGITEEVPAEVSA